LSGLGRASARPLERKVKHGGLILLHYSDEQIVGFVREAEKTEVTIAEFCRQKGFNEGTFYKKRFGSMQVTEVKRLCELELENARLKRLLPDRLIEIDAMQELLAKSGDG
jgi:putative transposase